MMTCRGVLSVSTMRNVIVARLKHVVMVHLDISSTVEMSSMRRLAMLQHTTGVFSTVTILGCSEHFILLKAILIQHVELDLTYSQLYEGAPNKK